MANSSAWLRAIFWWQADGFHADIRMPEKRGLLVFLVMATVVVFVGVVWAMATFLPFNLGGEVSPTMTEPAASIKTNCVHSIAYWKEHAEAYPAQLVIGEQVYQAGEIRSIFTNAASDPWDELQAQLVGAYLNIRWGADQSYIQPILFEAYGWLVAHPQGSELAEDEKEDATRLDNLLQAYNQGVSGVAACEPMIEVDETIASSKTAISSATLTSSPSSTATISEAPTSSEISPTTTDFYIPPTSTTQPTSIPPVQYPTNTKAPPTNTQPPPEIPTNTQPPQPTIPTNTTAPTSPPTKPPTLTPAPTEAPTLTQAPQ
jgi:hypothetical protein